MTHFLLWHRYLDVTPACSDSETNSINFYLRLWVESVSSSKSGSCGPTRFRRYGIFHMKTQRMRWSRFISRDRRHLVISRDHPVLSRSRSISFHLVESRALRIAIQIAIASNREIADSSRFHLARSRFISRDQRHLVISRDHLVLSRLSFSVTHVLNT